MKAGIFTMSTRLRMGSFPSTLLSIFLFYMALGVPLRADDEPVPLTPDFTAVVVKGGGLCPQLHTAPDGALLAFGYNAPAHTTLPGVVDCWASTDGGYPNSTTATTWVPSAGKHPLADDHETPPLAPLHRAIAHAARVSPASFRRLRMAGVQWAFFQQAGAAPQFPPRRRTSFSASWTAAAVISEPSLHSS